MRTVTIARSGGPEVLVLVNTEDPTARGDQVVVQVSAAGVNRADVLQREGHYPPPPDSPSTPGLEVSGHVVETGPDASWRIGDAVVALVDGGGYADRVLVPSAQALPAPAGVDLVDAAGLPEACCTVWSTLVTAAGLRPGERVLIRGGSGGVGSIAVQIATAHGAHVIATAGGPERTARCLELGAHVAIDHRSDDVAQQVLDATGGRGVDVVLDVVGAAALDANLRVLATGGRLAVIGLQGGRRAELDLTVLLTKRASVLGTTLRSRPAAEKAAIVADVRRHVWPMVTSGQVRPVVHARIRLDDVATAHRMLESGEVFGTLVLVP